MDTLNAYSVKDSDYENHLWKFNIDPNPCGRIMMLSMLKVRFTVKHTYLKNIKFVENKQTIIKRIDNSTPNTYCSVSPLQTLKYLPHFGQEYLKVIPISITDCDSYIDVVVNIYEAIYLPANTNNVHIEPTFSKTVLKNTIDNIEFDYSQIKLIDTKLNPDNHDSLVQLYTANLAF